MMPEIHNFFQKFFIPSLFILASTPAKAQITPDNTLGAEASSITPNVLIKGANADLINGGAQRGGNLFHSFTDFNINDGQRVYFGNPSGVQNILTRVTGGNASNILGTLGVNGNANLFLINPNGIVFGQNARLDVRGSFVGTTANGVQFGNQGIFSATNPQAPPLLTVNPSVLFFNQINKNATITNQSQAPTGVQLAGVDVTGLQVPDGKSLLLVGGNVNLDGGGLTASGGRVELAGLAALGSVGLNIAGDTLSLSVPNDVQRGNISLTNSAFVYVTGAGKGDIAINTGNLQMSNSFLLAGIGNGLGDGSTKAGDININADAIYLTNDAGIFSSTSGKGNASNIFITARDVISLDNGYIASLVVSNEAEGNAGNINITTGSLTATNGGGIGSTISGRGNAGNVTIKARDAVTFDRGSGLLSNVQSGAVGNGGNINITAGSLSLTNGGELTVSVYGADGTITGGQGIGGTVNINVRDALTIAGADSGVFGSLGAGAIGSGGNIEVQAGNVFVRGGGQIISSTFGKGDSGNISITARDAIFLDGTSYIINNVQSSNAVGNAGNIDIITDSLNVTNGAQINSFTRGRGNAGNITIQARYAVTFNGEDSNGFPSSSFSDVDTGGVGNGGNINITAGSLSLTNDGIVGADVRGQSATVAGGQGIGGTVNINVRDALTISGANSGIFGNLGAGAIGSGGNLDITTGSLTATNGAEINSFTSGRGNAGNITIQARDAVTFDGEDSNGNPSASFSDVQPGAVGNGGSINITASNLSLTNGGQLGVGVFGTSNTLPAGQGNGGIININLRDTLTVSGTNSNIRSGLGIGTLGRSGNIKIESGKVEVIDGGIITSRSTGIGTAGEIDIKANSVLLNNGQITAQTASSDGGNINLNLSDYLLLRNGSQISATAGNAQAGGNGGNITINTPFIVAVPKENSDITANAFSGAGGNINIFTQNIFGIEARPKPSDQTNDITASSQLGVQGQIAITQPQVQPTQGLIELPNEVIDASTKFSQLCPRDPNPKPLGKFIVTGRGSLPPSPLEFLTGTSISIPLATLDEQTATSTGGVITPVSKNPSPEIIEAQGMIKTADGEIALVTNSAIATPSSRPTAAVCHVSREN